jgi:hypothetical protein
MSDDPRIEAAAKAIHRSFWLRTYGEEAGTAEQVIRMTWEANRESRMNEARAALAAADAAAWRDISTAPKGHGEFLGPDLWLGNTTEAHLGCWCDGDSQQPACWMWDGESDPTHWMPLPGAPR